MPRPREFCVNEALDSAMDAFWKNGYEATSLFDLMEAMDLQKGSIYKAFGDKHSLFVAALQHYLEQAHMFDQSVLEDARSPREGIRAWLNRDIKQKCGDDMKRGCLMVNALTELAYKDEEVAKIIKTHIADLSKLLTRTIQQGQDMNQFRTDISAGELAQLLITHLFGLATMGKAVSSKSSTLQGNKNILMLLEGCV